MKKTLLTVATAALIGAMLFAPSHAEGEASTTTTTTAPTTTTTVVPTTTTTPVVTTTTTAPKPKPVVYTKAQVRWMRAMYVNSIQYEWLNPWPALKAYRIVATDRGWTPAQIKSWETAIINIMMGESGFCPNTLRGAIIKTNKGCVLKRQGRYEDAGFGQMIGIHYRITRPGTGWLCKEEGLCSKWAIISSPWASMTSLVALIERSGTAGWCYNAAARRYHRVACSNPGLDVG